MALHLADTVGDTVAFVFGDRGQDGEHRLGNAVAAWVATEVDHVQADAVRLQFLKRTESVGSGSEGAVEARCNDNVAGLRRLKQALAFRAVGERRGPADTTFNKELSDGPARGRGMIPRIKLSAILSLAAFAFGLAGLLIFVGQIIIWLRIAEWRSFSVAALLYGLGIPEPHPTLKLVRTAKNRRLRYHHDA
jgi:hypothetical protein